MRYSLAIQHWRELRGVAAARHQRLLSLYADPAHVMPLAEKRIELLIRALNFLYRALGLFAATSLPGLAGVFLRREDGDGVRSTVTLCEAVDGSLALLCLPGAVATFALETRCRGVRRRP